ncbi:MAG: hypothetical protein V4510_07660 [bacterium]
MAGSALQFAVAAVAVAALAAGVAWPLLDHASGDTPAGPPVPTAAQVAAACNVGGTPCVQDQLEAVMLAHGLEPAFALLDQLSASDAAVMHEQHNIAHHLGRASLGYYPSSTEALRHCPTTMASGCFHGVLERHFNDVGPPTRKADVTALCTDAEGSFRFFQCLHGLGHGLDMVAMHQLPTALQWCDLFDDSWARESCAGGVFMENVQGDVTMQHEDMPGMSGMGGMNMTWEPLRPADPLYPCNQVAERWWHACYWMQSSVLLKEGKTTSEVFAACDLAPAPFDEVCYESMGRDISGAQLRDGPKVLRQCGLGNVTRLPHCIYGAVQEMVNNKGDAAPGFAFCPTVPTDSKLLCYRAVGIMVHSLVADAAGRAAACGKAEAEFVQVCTVAARA